MGIRYIKIVLKIKLINIIKKYLKNFITMNTYIINCVEDFNKHFKIFKESAKIGSKPNVFILGFDTESINTKLYNKNIDWVINVTNNNIATCTIQLASQTMCLIINLVKLKYPLPKQLIKLLTNDCYIKTGIGIENDLLNLSNNYNLGHLSGSIELKNIALLGKHKNPSLETLFSQMVVDYKKEISCIRDWTQDLSYEQLNYAAKDAMMSLQLFNAIMKPALDNIANISTDDKNILKVNLVDKPQPSIITDNYIGKLNEIAQKKAIKMPNYQCEVSLLH